jgi:hypothetical protein
MSRNTKIILGVLGGLAVVCLCVCVGGWIALRMSGDMLGKTMAIEDPAEAARIARNMIDYELPPGYREEAALNILVMKMVILAESGAPEAGSTRPLIILVGTSMDAGLSEDEIRNQIQDQILQSMQTQGYAMKLVDQQAALIRGQDASLYIYKGADENGNEVRQVVSSLFRGKEGMVLVMIAGPERTWDQAMVDHFLNSIY